MIRSRRPGPAGLARPVRRIRSLAAIRRGRASPAGPRAGRPAVEVLGELLDRAPMVQPDATTCGAAVLVVCRRLAGHAAVDFTRASLEMHRTTNRWRDVEGRWQLRWPLRFGTSPWATARLLNAGPGLFEVRYRVAVLDPVHPERLFRQLSESVRRGYPCPLFVGDRWCPRHVILAVGIEPDGLTVYEPSAGHLVRLSASGFATGRLGVAGWDEPWLAVLPGGR